MTGQEILEFWLQAVNDGDVDALVNLYADGATLFPTFSPHALADAQAIRSYFEALASRPALAVSLYRSRLYQHELPGGLVVLAGVYAFKFEVDDDLLTFPSRFTMVLDPGAKIASLARAGPGIHSQAPKPWVRSAYCTTRGGPSARTWRILWAQLCMRGGSQRRLRGRSR